MKRSSSQLSVAQYTAMITGLQAFLATATFIVAGRSFTGAEAIAFLQTLYNLAKASADARQQYRDAVIADREGEAQNGAMAREMRDAIALMYSNSPATLAVFGLSPKKEPRPLSAEARAAAEAKAKATRVARGTRGPVAKLAIHGDVTGVTITPITSGTAAAGSDTTTTTGAPAPVTVAPVATGAATTSSSGNTGAGASAPVTVVPVATGTAAAMPHS